MLPDDVLLEIFDFYHDADGDMQSKQRMEEWITLAHVCRRWRSVVLQSPHRLNLRLFCTPRTPTRDTLDVWLPLPLFVSNYGYGSSRGVDNIVAALEHSDRVCHIDLRIHSTSEWEHVPNSAAMQKPFPELTRLRLGKYHDELESILPDSFLGGTAPRLRLVILDNVPFLGLLKLLLSATHIVKLHLFFIPRSGYIPPEVMATSLSALTSLE